MWPVWTGRIGPATSLTTPQSSSRHPSSRTPTPVRYNNDEQEDSEDEVSSRNVRQRTLAPQPLPVPAPPLLAVPDLVPLLSTNIQGERRQPIQIRRQFGLWSNPMQNTLAAEEQRAINFFYITCLNDYELAWTNRLPHPNSLLHIVPELEQASKLQELKILYGIRKLHLNMLTLRETKCSCCGVMWTEPGVFTKPPEPHWELQHGGRKHVFMNYNSNQFEYCSKASANRRPELRKCDEVCSKCLKHLTNSKIVLPPEFSIQSGYNLGTLPPQCFVDMTLVEECLIARISPCMCIGLLPNGSGTSQSGGIVCIDRSDTVRELAQELPNLAADLNFVFLVRKRAPSGPSTDPRFHRVRELKCNRARVHACLQYCLRTNPGYKDLNMRISNERLQLLPLDGTVIPSVLEAEDEVMTQIRGLADVGGPAPLQREVDSNPLPQQDASPETHEIGGEAMDIDQFHTAVEHDPDMQADEADTSDTAGINRALNEAPGDWPVTCYMLVEEHGGNATVQRVEQDLESMRHNLARNAPPTVQPSPLPTAPPYATPPHVLPSPVPTAHLSVPTEPQHTQNRHSGRFVHAYGHRTPLDPSKLKFFWSMAFPSLFLSTEIQCHDGSTSFDSSADFICDAPRSFSATFVEWLNWISNVHYRYMSHPTFPFVALATKNRITMTSSVSYGVTTMGHLTPLTRAHLLQLVEDSRVAGAPVIPSLTAKMTSWTRNVVGSSPYWWDVKKKVNAFVQQLFLHENRVPSLFMTTSLAEFHVQPLHRFLEQAFTMQDMPEHAAASSFVARGEATPSEHSRKFRDNIKNSPLLIDSYAELKLEAYKKIILQQVLDVDEYFITGEYAESRDMKHHHSIAYCRVLEDTAHEIMNRCIQARSMDELVALEKDAAERIYASLPVCFTKITALHPAGQTRSNPDVPCNTPYYKLRVKVARGLETNIDVVNKVRLGPGDFSPDRIGNVDEWPGHEGLASQPTSLCLRRLSHQMPIENLQCHLIELENRVGLHACSAYCLCLQPERKSTINPIPQQSANFPRSLICRQRFGTENRLVAARTDGMPSCESPCFTQVGSRSIFTAPRDHPRLKQGSSLLQAAICANQDTQILLCPKVDIEPLLPNQNLFDWIDYWFITLDYLNEEERDKLVQVKCSRDYFDKSDFLSVVEDYICDYISKTEKSPQQAQQLLLAVLQNENINANVTTKSLALMLNS